MCEHLTKEQLLQFVDGELSRRGMEKTEKHLQSCWACRTQYERLKDDISSIYESQTRVFLPSLPAPPKPWSRLEPRLYAAAQKKESAFFLQRVIPEWRTALRFPGALASLAVLSMLLAVLIWLPPKSVSASEVLRRAEASDASRFSVMPNEVIRQHVLIKRVKPRLPGTASAELDSWRTAKSSYWNAGTDPLISDLQSRYITVGIPTALPLSSAVAVSWGNLTGSRPDTTVESGDVEVRYVSNPHALIDGLKEVSFRVAKSDWHLHEMKLFFAEATYDISEENIAIVSRSNVPQDVLAHLEPRELNPIEKHPHEDVAKATKPLTLGYQPVQPLTDDRELQVRYDLHRLGADLGESIEVSTRPNGNVVINAWGISPERKSQLTGLFAGKLGVQLEFQPTDLPGVNDAGVLRHGPPRVVVIPSEPAVTHPYDKRLEDYLGGAAEEESYTRTVLDVSTSILSHLYALHGLAVRWPQGSDVPLSDEARKELFLMIQDHTRALQSETESLNTKLMPLANHFGYEIESGVVAASQIPWQGASVSGLEAGKSVDHVLRLLLSATGTPISLDEAFPKLREQFQDLNRAIESLSSTSTQY